MRVTPPPPLTTYSVYKKYAILMKAQFTFFRERDSLGSPIDFETPVSLGDMIQGRLDFNLLSDSLDTYTMYTGFIR